jgi:hypothetical protein
MRRIASLLLGSAAVCFISACDAPAPKVWDRNCTARVETTDGGRVERFVNSTPAFQSVNNVASWAAPPTGGPVEFGIQFRASRTALGQPTSWGLTVKIVKDQDPAKFSARIIRVRDGHVLFNGGKFWKVQSPMNTALYTPDQPTPLDIGPTDDVRVETSYDGQVISRETFFTSRRDKLQQQFAEVMRLIEANDDRYCLIKH